MRPRLRLFTGKDAGTVVERPVTVRLGDIPKALTDSIEWDRTWLTDFEDDEIQVPADLYEVLSAYRHLRPSA